MRHNAELKYKILHFRAVLCLIGRLAECRLRYGPTPLWSSYTRCTRFFRKRLTKKSKKPVCTVSISLESIAYHEGAYRPLGECGVNLATHAFQYGTMVIGGIRGYYNQGDKELYIFRLTEHIQRLARSAHIMQMKLPLGEKEMADVLLELARRNQCRANTYFRPFIYKSALQLSPRLHDVEDSFGLYSIPLEDYLDTKSGLRVAVSSWRRMDENVVPARVKSSGGYINSALAKSEAVQNGFDEAIFLDSRGFVCEGSAENIFMVREGKLITPPLSASVLEGITRSSLLTLAQDLKIPTVERDIARGELYIAEEIFLCGTGAQVAWVGELDRRQIGNGEIGLITKKLRDQFLKIVKGEDERYRKWLRPAHAKS